MSDEPIIDPETFAKLKSIPDSEWSKIYSDLILYTDAKLRKCNFGIKSEKDSRSTEDFVQDAIERVFSGVRKWDYEKHPDILIHLKGVIKSIISSHFKSSSRAAQKVLVRDVEIIEVGDEAWQIHDLDQPDEITFGEEIWEAIENKFDDQEACILFFEWCDGKKPKDISVEWSVEPKVIYAAIKKGKQIAEAIIRSN